MSGHSCLSTVKKIERGGGLIIVVSILVQLFATVITDGDQEADG